MKDKKLPLIIGIILLLAVVGVILYFVLNKKITITFIDDSTTVQTLKIKKGEKITLPDVDKEGYNFEGWYYNGNKVSKDDTFSKDTTIVGKWIIVGASTMTFTFDTVGGNKIEPLTVECDTEFHLPTPTKSGYKFLEWRDKNEIVISYETKLVCEDVELKANWEQITTTTKASTTTTAKKEYTCPSGYTLDGTKCTITKNVSTKCEGTRVFEYEGKCVTITGTARKDTQKACPKQHVTYMSFAGEVDGKVVNWGVTGCAYYKTNDTSKDTCESHGFKWVTPESACYVKWVNNNTINTCDHLTNYAYITNPNSYDGVNGLNGGCYPLSNKTKYCAADYTLTNNKCVKTIDATLK